MKQYSAAQIRTVIQNTFIVVAALGLFFFSARTLITTVLMIPPRWDALQQLQDQGSGLRSKYQVLTTYQQSDIEDLLQQIHTAVPEQKEVGMLLAGITTIAQNTDVQIVTISLSPGAVSSPSGEAVQQQSGETQEFDQGHRGQPFQVELQGSLDQLVNFLKEITHSRRLLGVSAVSLTFQPEEITASVLGSAYFSPPYIPPFAVADPLEEVNAEERTLLGTVMSYPFVSEATTSGSGVFDRENLFTPQ